MEERSSEYPMSRDWIIEGPIEAFPRLPPYIPGYGTDKLSPYTIPVDIGIENQPRLLCGLRDLLLFFFVRRDNRGHQALILTDHGTEGQDLDREVLLNETEERRCGEDEKATSYNRGRKVKRNGI